MRVRPAAGLTVLDPYTLIPLPVDGADVEATTDWHRLILAGDLEVVVETPVVVVDTPVVIEVEAPKRRRRRAS